MLCNLCFINVLTICIFYINYWYHLFLFYFQAACNYSGIVAYEIHEDNIDTVIFTEFLYTKIADISNAYPGENSIILLDNASWHNRRLIGDFCDHFSILPLYLPSYYPLLNLTEYQFLGMYIFLIYIYNICVKELV